MKLNRRGWIVLAAFVAVLGALAQQFATHRTPRDQPPLIYLGADGLAALRTDFNAAANSVRMIVLLSPT
jgi:hypothetical protein